MHGPWAVSASFRYSIYLPVMACMWDDPAFGPLSFRYYGA